jgi:hypothetical protein
MLIKVSGEKGELREGDVTYDTDKGQLLRWKKPYTGTGLLPCLEKVVSEHEVFTDINTGRNITARKPKQDIGFELSEARQYIQEYVKKTYKRGDITGEGMIHGAEMVENFLRGKGRRRC